MNINSFIEECQNNGIFLCLNEKGNISYESLTGRIPKSTFEDIKRYKPLLVNHFRERKNTSFTGIKNTKNAQLHADNADSAQVNLEKNNTDIGSFEPNIVYRNPKQVSLAFEQAKIALLEYQDYIEAQTLLQEDPSDKKLHEASVSKWNLYVRAYESLPEYRALLAVQKQLEVSPQPLSAVKYPLDGQSVLKPIIGSPPTHDDFKQVLKYLIHRPTPSNFPKDKWEVLTQQLQQFAVNDCSHIQDFIKHKYSIHEVFGCHPVKPYERYDYRGFILALNPYLRIHEVREDKVVFETVKGHAIQTSRRKVQIPTNWITLMDLT